MKRSFQSLSPQEALHVAVFIEERNSEIYHQFAEMFVSFQDLPSIEIAGVLWDMAVEERHHSTLLQRRYSAEYGQAPCALTEADIHEMIELPHFDPSIFDSLAIDSSAQIQALKVALQAENQAREFYADLAKTANSLELRSLYLELCTLEAEHAEFLERKLASRSQQSSAAE